MLDIYSILILTGQCVRNERMPRRLMEMKMINLQRAELKDTPKIKVKKWCSRLVHFAEISLQQLKMVLSSLYGPHVLVLLMRRRMVSWGISSQIWTRASLSSWKVWGATWRRRMDRMSQRCSIGFRSGKRGGHSMVLIPSSSRNCLHTLATWGWALSCTRRNPGPTAPA